MPKLKLDKPLYTYARWFQLVLSSLGICLWVSIWGFESTRSKWPESQQFTTFSAILTMHFFPGIILLYRLWGQGFSWKRWLGESIWKVMVFGIAVTPTITQDMTMFGGQTAHLFLIKVVMVVVFLIDLSRIRLNYRSRKVHPALVFVLSFGIIITLGALALMLPRATHSGIHFMDALFTSVSAVCVTGLTVVDTGTYFTQLGQSIVLVLIQLGGLGILTFASYFSYLFKGGASYENQLALSDINSSNRLSDVFQTLKYIFGITLVVEAFSA
ncbi:MAG: potassium transporter TrkG, partial [Bacteroidia bacterium]